MSKTLYDEALADANKLREIAEDNAKKVVIEAVTPRIRELIEKKLFEADDDKDDVLLDNALDDELTDLDDVGELEASCDMSSCVEPSPSSDAAVVVTMTVTPGTDSEEKVVLDLDTVTDQHTDDMFELNLESIESLFSGKNRIDESLDEIAKNIKLAKSVSKVIKETKLYAGEIDKIISRIKNTYEYVQEHLQDGNQKAGYEARLEESYEIMKGLKERIQMKRRMKGLVNEGDLTIKLTGVPDELDVGDLGVDLVTDESAEDDGDEAGEDLDFAPESDELSDDMSDDVDEAEAPKADGDEDEDDVDDDQVVEISESMLRNEIAKMRKARLVRESDEFGGGKASGKEALDLELSEAETSKDDKKDEMCDEAEEASDEKKDDEAVPSTKKESYLRAKYVAEVKRQQSVREQIRKLTAESKSLQKNSQTAKLVESKLTTLKSELNESSQRSETFKKQYVVARKERVVKESRENRASTAVAEDRSHVESLRKKLNDTNLFNAKLLATNKLLQNEGLTAKQKSSTIERLDEAKTVREVKLVYESIVKALTSRRQVTESTSRVLGSSSRSTTPASTLTESVETDRWATLAGLK